jgi:two-component system sensor histidine kinase SenX3
LVVTPAPEGAPQSWAVLADQSLLEIAVLNLLDNACKYAELGTEVRIELRREAAQVGIAVIDQGPGICPDQQKRIFGDYVRLQPEGPVHGIGLGLAFVQRIAAVLNGSVKLDSSLGQGSTFSLWLPAFSAKNPS